jgi:hypothetical protein
MEIKMETHTETRWAMIECMEEGYALLGKYCWPDATKTEPIVRTFKTRDEARKAKLKMGSYAKSSKIVKVGMTIEAV